MEGEWAEEDSVLAGADVCKSFSSPFFLFWLSQRGFFVKRISYDLSGSSQVAVVVWRFW
jgi:hypothetical protein